jgi:outer membrane cobalamin receptor
LKAQANTGQKIPNLLQYFDPSFNEKLQPEQNNRAASILLTALL